MRIIYNGKITINEADQKQNSLSNTILNFNNKARPRPKVEKKKKIDTYESANALLDQMFKIILNIS